MSRVRLTLLSLGLVALVMLTAGGLPSPAAAGGRLLEPHVPGEILIKFKPTAGGLDRASAQAELNATRVHTFRSGAEHWRLGPGHGVEQALDRMQRNPQVEYVEPNYILTADVIPDDARFGELYGMRNTGQTGGTSDADIDADNAWDVSRGSRSVLVGIIDTGIDYNHPDLAANVWTNPGEIPGNGVDDDGNGYVDDVHGYDFINNDGDPFDDNGHGTHCAGTIGGVGNNGIGVAGVNWEVSLMGLKFLSAGGSGSLAHAVQAIDYSNDMGVDLTSNSWGGGGFSATMLAAIRAAGALEIPFVAAAGNNGTNNDTSPHFPSSYGDPDPPSQYAGNVIAVAATDHNDAVASFSNFGAQSVHVAAPGVNILSTQPGGGYQLLSGTSMATPHVAGVSALIKSRFPNIPAAQLKFAIMNFADQKAQLHPVTGSRPVASGGRVNAFFSIADPDNAAPGAISDLATGDAGSNHMGLSWTNTGDDGATGTATFFQVRYATSPIDDNNFSAATRAGNEPVPLASGTPQGMEVTGLAASTTYYFAMKAYDEWGNAGAISNLATGTTLPPPTVGLTPTSITDNLFTGQTADHTITLRNDGVGTLDFSIPSPSLADPLAAPAPTQPQGKGEPDPAPGDPVIAAAGGPDAFGYRWSDSNEPGGPAFVWTDISGTGTLITDVTLDEDTSAAIPLGFSFPFYGAFHSSIRVCSNGWLSFTSASTAYENSALPSSSAPENLVAAFWDDLDPNGTARVYFQSFGNRAIVQWHGMPRYQQTGSSLTFQAILEASGSITFQYHTLTGTLTSATVGLQNATRTIGLTTTSNQAYLANGLAVRYSVLPQWLSVTPASGRIPAGGSVTLNAHIDASGLEGGTYPGRINIHNNDPANPTVGVDVTLNVTGAPDATVQPSSLAYGDRFVGLPHDLSLTVANVGTDDLHVSGIASGHPDVTATPSSFTVAPHASQTVSVRWVPSALGPLSTSLGISSDDGGEPVITVPVTGNAIPAPVVVVNPTSLTETLFSGNTATRTLTVSNAGGSDLIVTAAADQGNGGTGMVISDPVALGNGGPDSFGYRWRDSDASGGPQFNFIDISATGTPISFSSSDDSLSSVISMGMSFPLYGTSFGSMKVSTNGWLTFDTTTTSSAAGNGTLPSTNLGRSAIAMFWDDLHLRSGNVRYLNDGTRFIVQYTNVGRFSTTTGQSYTFQAQLYPSGRILLMYRTMTGVLNSATIGIQNQARNVALQVVNSAAYMHDNLAILISRTPDWLTVTPSGATIPPGTSQDFTVAFDSTDRTGGQLNGNIVLGTNIPGQSEVLVPATLNVIGAPRAAVLPTSFSYGTVFIGYPMLTTFQVVNNGTADLNVSDITTTDPTLTVEDPPGPTVSFPLPPGGARLFNLRWSPTSVGPLAAEVRVLSDDPVNPTATMSVTGSAILPPVASASPASFTESLLVGDVVTRNLQIDNQGGSDLTFSTALRALGGSPVTVYPELELKKDEVDPRPGILGGGGPDLFGYRWRDSGAPGGPAFSWVDISGIGTPIGNLDGDDENSGALPIGFNFPYYGNSYSTVRVTTNGWLSFTSSSTDLGNSPLPNTGEPENMIAVFWDDLHFRGAVRARYHNDGSRFIVQWTDVDRFSTTQPSPAHLTFQAILYPNGRIVLQYLTMFGVLNDATIGQQNTSRNDGLTVVHNAAYMHDGLAIRIDPPVGFLSVAPTDGTIPAGGSASLEVRIDTNGLIGGDYAAAIDLLTNDPARGLITAPVNLHVTGIPNIEAAPGTLSFPTTFLGFSSTLPLTIRNTGTDLLTITDAVVSPYFTLSGLSTPVTLPPDTAIPATVTFTPALPGPAAGTITISSNDPDGDIVVDLTGDALVPPEVGVAPASISTALPPAASRTKTLTITNTGGSDLDWTTGASMISAIQPGTYVELAKDEIDTRLGLLGDGGPDMFGYRWVDSDEPGGPVFAWTDISGIGTPITALTGDDQNAGPIAIGFGFPFYGTTFTSVRVTTNGWLSFTSTATSFSNQPLPNTSSSVPNNLLAAFWDDLNFRGAVHAHYHNDGSRFIVQWTDVDRHPAADLPNPDHLTFQVILYPSGKIVYQYLTMDGRLDSATVGIQNAAKDDGLNVVFNAAYLHDNMAIQFLPLPEWLTVAPTGGTIPPGGSQDLTVTLNAMGLEDGLHEGSVNVSSNDPYTPTVGVPVSLYVGLVEPAYLNFDPDVLNLSSGGNTVKMVIEPPAGYDAHDVVVSSVTMNDTLQALPSPVSYTDENGNGVDEIVVRFDRDAVEAILTPGTAVLVTIQGEVADQVWFRGTTEIRALRPRITAPAGGAYLTAGTDVTVRWDPPYPGGGVRYHVLLTRDGGSTWEMLSSNQSATSYLWTVGGTPSANARIRVVASDSTGVMGYDTTAEFILAAPMSPPNDIGDSLELVLDGAEVELKWARPAADPFHGPVSSYRVLRSFSPQGPFVEVGNVTTEAFREALSDTSGAGFVYYRIVATNAAGDSQ